MSVGCPSLPELPDLPLGKTGWPWTKQADVLRETQPSGAPRPKSRIVASSYTSVPRQYTLMTRCYTSIIR